MTKKVFNIVFKNENERNLYKELLQEKYSNKYTILYEKQHLFCWHMGVEINFFDDISLLKHFMKDSIDENNSNRLISSIQHKCAIDNTMQVYTSTGGSNIIFAQQFNSYIFHMDYCHHSYSLSNAVSRTANYKYLYNTINYNGLIWFNNKVYEYQTLCFSYRYGSSNQELIYLTELKDDFNPMFNIFTPTFGYSSNNWSFANSPFSHSAEEILDSISIFGSSKKQILACWARNSQHIKDKETREELMGTFGLSMTYDNTGLNNIIEKAITDSFDKIFDVANVTIKVKSDNLFIVKALFRFYANLIIM